MRFSFKCKPNPLQHMRQSEHTALCNGNQLERAGPAQTLIPRFIT